MGNLRGIGLVAALLVGIVAAPASALDPVTFCKLAKAKAAGTALSKVMACKAARAKADALGKDFNTSECIDAAQQKMIATFVRIEVKYACQFPGNGSDVAAVIAARVDDIFDSL